MYRVATYLDPRYKNKFFSSKTTDVVKLHVARLCEEIRNENELQPDSCITSPKKKRRDGSPKPSCSKSSTLTESMNKILASSSDDEEYVTSDISVDILEKYHKEKRLGTHENAMKWWGEKSKEYQNIAKVACVYLSCPPSSVPSERLFSGAGRIYDERRTRL